MKLSLVIPTYNEESNITKLLNKCHEMLKSAGISHELIVVDDMSSDGTRREVRELQTNIGEIVLIERRERGIATALRDGYNASKGELLGSIDADLAHDPALLPEMVSMVDSGKCHFVIGSRYAPGSMVVGKPLLNMLASRMGQIFVRLVYKFPVRDTSNNYRVFRREIWDKVKTSLHPSGNVMIFELAFKAYKSGYKIKEIPITYVERRFGKSKIRVFKETLMFFRTVSHIR